MYQLQQPVFDKAPSTFRATNPHGLSIQEEQALSSSGSPFWQLPNQRASAFASTDKPASSQQERRHCAFDGQFVQLIVVVAPGAGLRVRPFFAVRVYRRSALHCCNELASRLFGSRPPWVNLPA